MDRNDVLDLLTIVAVADKRTVGEADVLLWGQVIGQLDKDDCLDAIMAHRRDQPGVWLEPGHIFGRVKAMRRDRLDRMDPDERAQSVGGSDVPRDRYGYVDKSADRDRRVPAQLESAADAMPRGTYIDADPAGWEYGMPLSPSDPDFDPDERRRLRVELDSRIRVYMEKNPGCGSKAEAEHAIRVKDRDRAAQMLRKIKRGDLADMFGGESFIEAEVVEPDVVESDASVEAGVSDNLF